MSVFKGLKTLAKTVVAINVATTVAVTAVTVVADINRRNKKVDYSKVKPTQAYPIIKMDTPHIAAATKNLMGQPIIIFNSEFRTLSKATQKAVMNHEVGHHVLGHLDNEMALAAYNGVRGLYPLLGQVISIELEADAYAASVVGNDNMIAALQELKGLPSIPDTAKRELNIRIRALGGQA